MLPIQLVGLALAGRTLLSKYSNNYTDDNREPIHIPLPKLFTSRPLSSVNPIESLSKTLSSSLSQIRKIAFGEITAKENYSSIVKRFIPKDVDLLLPSRPSYVKEIHLTDLDGDLSDELITSYKFNDEIRTIILKKEKDVWYKASEISNKGYSGINYRDVVDISGTGKRHLLLGLSSKGKPSTVHGYSFDGAGTKEIFSNNYNKMDVFSKSSEDSKSVSKRYDLAFWHQQTDGSYNIQLLRWNGLGFEQVEDDNNYYRKKVIPYLVAKTRQTPYSASNWHNLAYTLEKIGAKNDALTASKVAKDLEV